jgi:hypothetical protein
VTGDRLIAAVRARQVLLLRLALAAAQVAALFWFARRDGLPLDDAWIHQVVARTFANSGTLGFAPGQFGAAATSYLWAAVLGVNLAVLHLDPVVWSFAVNLVASLVSGQALLALLWRTAPTGVDAVAWRGIAWAAALVASTGANVLWFAHSGMEASTVIALSLVAVWAATVAPRTTRRMVGAGVACALLAWTRPEGAPLGILLGVYALYRRQGIARALGALGPTVLALLAYAAVNFAKTGHALPSTLAGRRWLWFEAVSGESWPQRAGDFAEQWGTRLGTYTFDTGTLGLAVFLGLALWGGVRLLRTANDGARLLFTWAAGHVAFYLLLLPTPGHGGRYQPLVPLLFAVCVVLGAAFAAHDLARVLGAGPRVTRALALAAALPWVVLSALTATDLRKANALAVDHIRTTELGTGAFLATLPEDGAIASFDIGGTAWASRRQVLDAGGLSDPATAKLLERGRIWEVLKEHDVRYLVLPEGRERVLPVIDDFARRLHLAGNDALHLERIHELETPFERWAPSIKSTWNAAPKQVVYRVEYTGKPGPADTAPPPLDAHRPVRDPGALAPARDRAIAEHMLAVLAAWGVNVDVALSATRSAQLEGECAIELGLWGVAVHGCAGVGDAPALEAALYEQTWRYLELEDVGGALKNVAHVVARVKQRTTAGFDPQLAPVLPPSPPERGTGPVFVLVLLGVALAGLLLHRGASGALRMPWRPRQGGSALRAGAVGLFVVGALATGCGHDALGPATLADAAREGDIDALTRMLAAGAPVGAADADGNTALHAAVRAGRADAVAVLLHAGAPLAATAGRRHRTALHEAALQGTPETLLALLAAGAEPGVRDTFGETPLHLLVRADAVRAVCARLHRRARRRRGQCAHAPARRPRARAAPRGCARTVGRDAPRRGPPLRQRSHRRDPLPAGRAPQPSRCRSAAPRGGALRLRGAGRGARRGGGRSRAPRRRQDGARRRARAREPPRRCPAPAAPARGGHEAPMTSPAQGLLGKVLPRAGAIAPMVLALACVAAVVEALHHQTFATFGRDQGIFQYVGWALRHGARPYRDFHEINGPLPHLYHALMQELGGEDEHVFRTLDTLLLCGVYALAAPAIPRWVGLELRRGDRLLWALAGVAVLGAQYVRYDWWHTSQREGLYAILVLASLALQGAAHEARDAHRAVRLFALAGAATALPWFGKPPCVVFALLQVAVALHDRANLPVKPLRALAAGVGGAAVTSGVMIGFVLVFEDAAQGVRMLSQVPLLHHTIWNLSLLECYRAFGNAPRIDWALGITAAFVAAFFALRLPRRALLALVLPVGGFVVFASQGKGFPYHLHMVTLGMGAMELVLVAALARRAQQGSAAFGAAAAVGALLLGLQCREDAVMSPGTKGDWAKIGATKDMRASGAYLDHFEWGDFFARDLRDAASFVESRTRDGERVQTYGLDPYFLFLAHRHSASPVIYDFELNVDAALKGGSGAMPSAADRAALLAYRDAAEELVLAAVQASPPAAFVFFDKAPFSYPEDGEADFKAHCPKVAAWLADRYVPAARFGTVRVRMRLDAARPR